MSSTEPVSVAVPATSANLGPGFDSFGVALTLHLRATALPREARRIVASGLGADELPSDDSNLVWRAFASYCARFGVELPDISIAVDNDIPLERGLGSSSAAAVAGIALARAVTRAGGSNQDLVDLAAGFDGHPDNVAPAVLGGLVACLGGQANRLEPTARLRPVVCVPDVRQNTNAARAVLPETLSLADAAANGARAAVVLAGLAGAMAWLPQAMNDVLHEPARLNVMTDSGRLIEALRADGIGACLSGAGPTVLAVVPRAEADVVTRIQAFAGPGWHVLALDWERGGTRYSQSPAVGAAAANS